jgi:uncharacterized MAPEG superfamily protein
MHLSYWSLLGFTFWTLLLLVFGIGVTRVSQVMRKEARANSFNPSVPHGSDAYQRRMRAHLNCVENLPVFASLVLLGAVLGMTGPWFQITALTVLPARVGQSVVHISSGRNRATLARFAFFTVQLLCFTIMGVLLIARGLQDGSPTP